MATRPSKRCIPAVAVLDGREGATPLVVSVAAGTAGAALVAVVGQRLVAETRSHFANYPALSEPGALSTGEPLPAPVAYAPGSAHAVVFMEGWQREQTDTSDEANL